MELMYGFALKTLKHRKAGFAGAFIALLFAAALVCACGMLLDTGLRGTVVPERYAGAPVIVAGDQFTRQTEVKDDGETKIKEKPLVEHVWIPAKLTGTIEQLPGVERVIAEVTFPAYVKGGRFQGHGWESAALTPFTIADGQEPRTPDEVVVDADAGLATGANIDVQTASGLKTYRVSGVTAQALPSQDTLFFATQEARRLAGRQGKVSAIGVFPQVDVKVDGATTYTGDARGKVEFLDAEKSRVQLISLGGALGGTSLLVAILVVTGTFALSIQQRQRELALLRAIAATPKQLRKLLGGEALMISLVAGVAGSVLGIGLGFWLRSMFVSLGAMPENLPLVVSPFPMLAALGATVLAAWAAARVSARRTARIRPVEALGEAAVQSAKLPLVRTIAGLLFLAGGVVLTVVLSGLSSESAASPIVMLTGLLLASAVSLLGPAIAMAAVVLLQVPLRTSRIGGFLAAANLRTGSKRFGSIIAPLSLMVAMTCTILFVQSTMGHAAQEQIAAGSRADFVLGPRVPGVTAQAVAKVPGVEAVTEVLRTTVMVDLDKYGAQAVTDEGQTLDLGVIAGSMEKFGKDSIAVSQNAAASLGLSVGGEVRLVLGDGTPAVLKVVAIYARGLGYGELTLPHSLVAPHVDDPLGTLLVSAPGVSRDALAKAAPGIAVLDQAEAVEAGSTNAAVNYVAMGLIIAFTALSVVNTLAMSTSDRSRELALLRLVGTTRRQVLRMLRLETATAVLVSVVIGSVIAAVTLAAFSTGMTGSALPHIPALTYLGVIAATAALALAATVVPARLALKQRPADAIGARQ